MSTERSTGPRGITHGYQNRADLPGKSPSFSKEADTLWQGWDKTVANPDHTGAQTYQDKRKQGQDIDREVHKRPVSRLETERLKAERSKAQPHSRLIPKGPDAAAVRSAEHSKRERRIAFQEKRLSAEHGKARQSFERSSKAQTRGPMRGPSR